MITSSWRKEPSGITILLNALKSYGLDKQVIGYTPIMNTRREIEINQYLKTFKEMPNYIILDDDIADLEELSQYLIKTDIKIGLTYKNVKDGIKVLTKTRKK